MHAPRALPDTAVARRFATTNATVGEWRRRFIARGIEGLHDEWRPGKPRSIDDERIAALLNTTLHAKPKDGATHWSVRGLAAETGIAKTSVHRFLQAFGLQPHRRDSFKLWTDPFFIEKLRDVVGLYLNPPIRRWSCVSTRKARSRRSSAPSRCCRWASATSRA